MAAEPGSGVLDRELVRLAVIGSVDDGKSTLLGRLLHDACALPQDHLAALRQHTARQGFDGGDVDFSLVTDGLRAEREQGITIDVAYRHLVTPARRFLIADTPGHEQYTRNMATGASTADVAVILLDARLGVTGQTRRHALISSLFGINHLVVVVNKMDLVDFSQKAFDGVRRAFEGAAARLGLADLVCIPVSALQGDNVVRHSQRMPWYRGATLLHHLETVHVAGNRNLIDLRLPIQMVLRSAGRRVYAGQLASGVVRCGEQVMALPSRRSARVTRIHAGGRLAEAAFAPQSIAVELDSDIDLGRGAMVTHPHNLPREVDSAELMVVWMAERPARAGLAVAVLHTHRQVNAEIRTIRYRLHVDTLRRAETTRLELNDIGRVEVGFRQPLWVDPYRTNRITGAMVLVDPATGATLGAGMVLDRRSAHRSSQARQHPYSSEKKAAGVRTGLAPVAVPGRGLVVWLTGLPASGKTTLAREVERQLLAGGRSACVLDGDRLRAGLSADLGYSSADRSTHIRRVAQVAAILADAGLVAIVALISPTRADRAAARQVCGADRFYEIFVDTPLEICEGRDPKGLYRQARQGTLAEFTGVSAPYEPPRHPELLVDTVHLTPEQGARAILAALPDPGP